MPDGTHICIYSHALVIHTHYCNTKNKIIYIKYNRHLLSYKAWLNITPLFIETDASKVGVGGVLLLAEENLKESEIEDDTLPMTFQLKPVAYASKSLTSTENYSNIECEALGVLHSLEKFHHYCFGHVHIITDHRPLLSLMH